MAVDDRGKTPITPEALAAEPVLGTVIEPGPEAGSFVFATPDDQQATTGEFVAYAQPLVGDDGATERVVFARVAGREQVDTLPTAFMSNPDVAPRRVAAALGVDREDRSLYRITAAVVGYYDDQFESFRNPRQVPTEGTLVRRAPGAMLEVAISNVTPPHLRDPAAPDPGTAHVGRLLNRPGEEVRVELPVNEIAATHLAILASTGSGKSYTASVLLEEMLKPATRASVLVFDPHGEYDSLDQMVDDPAFAGEDGYAPDVVIRDSSDLNVRIADLTFADLSEVLGPTERMSSVLDDAYQALQRRNGAYSARKLQTTCDEHHPDDDASGLRWRINRNLIQSNFFSTHDRLDLDTLINPGQVTVLKLNGLSRRDQQMMAAVLLRKLYQGREAVVTGDPDAVDHPVEHPVFTLFEEAHRFAPDGDSHALGIIRQINSEGRKFGLGTGLLSQRPSKLDQTVLSQCGTQITMQITNPADQQAIRDAVESAGEAVLDELPGLTRGQAVISGDAVNTTVLAKIRARETTHEAESLAADRLWREAYDEARSAPGGSRSVASDDPTYEDTELGD